ncbi:hypothetical protein [Streptosporangium sp. NPDC050280]
MHRHRLPARDTVPGAVLHDAATHLEALRDLLSRPHPIADLARYLL